MGHGTVHACKGPHAGEAPFSRLLRREDPLHDSHAIALLAGSQGPMMPPVAAAAGKPALPAGFTFLGQFIDHDLTEFRAVEGMRALPANPVLGVRQAVAPEPGVTATNGRTGLFDLDSVYGLLGAPDERLFKRRKGLFRLGSERRTVGNLAAPRDLARFESTGAERLIADPRNDENKIIVQLHTLFMRLHNHVHRAKGGGHAFGSPQFDATCATVKAVYQRIVLRDYLPRLVGQTEIAAVVDRLRGGTAFFSDMARQLHEAEACPPGRAPMPVEFAQACFRLGHSQLRQGYQLNAAGGRPLFRAGGGDLRGREPIDASTEIDWALFFGPAAQLGEPLDATLPEATFRLPAPAVDAPPISLAERNIRRGIDFGVCSGQTAAVSLGLRYPHVGAPLTADELALDAEILRADPSLATQTPLWFYILREAEVKAGGDSTLGPVGGLIVAESMLGALHLGGADVTQAVGAAPSDAVPAAPPPVEAIDSMTGLLKALGEL